MAIYPGVLYPLVNILTELWKDPPCSMGKFTMSMTHAQWQTVELPEDSFRIMFDEKYSTMVQFSMVLKTSPWKMSDHEHAMLRPGRPLTRS